MGFEFGEIVLVRFPFTDLSASKQRPAVVVSSIAYSEQRPDVVLMAVSSRVRQPQAFGEIRIEGWAASGLLKLSVVKPVIATFQQDVVLKRLGKLAPADRTALLCGLSALLGLSEEG